ncbi:hypothetical protein TSUD_280320, partial [Trifolium subterraneum]
FLAVQCEEAFQKLKAFLASPPVLSRPKQGTPLTLYLAVSENAMSAALVQEVDDEEKPIYFISRIFRDAETRYRKIEKLSLAVIVTARRLRHYFQSHRIMVKTDYPIKQVLQKQDLAGRMVAWSIELSEFDIVFSPRGSIKSQVLADFVLEMTTPPEAISTQPWTFNNQAEYEALIAGMKLAREMEVEDLRAKSDSQLVTNQVAGEYQTKDPQLMKYLEKVKSLAKQFKTFELVHVPRDQNSRADLLSKLASTKKPGNNRTVIQETISTPSTETLEVVLPLEQEDWRHPIIKYLLNDEIPLEREKAIKIRKMAAHYTMIGNRLYKRGFSSPLLLCVGDPEAQTIIKEIHDGSCGNHIGARSLAGKVARAGYFWPTLFQDGSRYVRSCDECQKHADIHHAPGEQLQSVMSPWPFYMWGVDIVGPFSTSQGQVKFLIVAVDYFTKWIEAEPVATISSEKVKHFYWKKLICRFGLPKYIVSDNDTQFTSESVIQFCEEKGIRNTFVSVEHPQANGQAESANKVVLKALKRNLMRKGKSWAEHIPAILWSYHTTTHTSTGETPFKMVYGTDAMIPAEINPPSWRRETLTAPDNDAALQENLDLLEEVREAAHLREFTAKQRARRKYDTRVIPRKFEAGDLVLKRPMGRDKGGKLAPNWEGPFRIQEIKMSPTDAPHTAFMTNTCNFFYKVMPFGLKNAGATYQRLMDRVFQKQIGKNLEVYIDDMVVKTAKEGDHNRDLDEILKEVRKYNMRLNPAKCSFGVQAGKFLGFMLTSRGIEANPEKCQAIINMRSPTTVKEVQQLTGRIAALSREGDASSTTGRYSTSSFPVKDEGDIITQSLLLLLSLSLSSLLELNQNLGINPCTLGFKEGEVGELPDSSLNSRRITITKQQKQAEQNRKGERGLLYLISGFRSGLLSKQGEYMTAKTNRSQK